MGNSPNFEREVTLPDKEWANSRIFQARARIERLHRTFWRARLSVPVGLSATTALSGHRLGLQDEEAGEPQQRLWKEIAENLYRVTSIARDRPMRLSPLITAASLPDLDFDKHHSVLRYRELCAVLPQVLPIEEIGASATEVQVVSK